MRHYARTAVIQSPTALSALVDRWRRGGDSRRRGARGDSIGFVPTMGALHRGHLSLIAAARRENRRVVVSIFVNPLQFGPREDLSRYPRPFARDRRLCAGAGADALYHPSPRSMYPEGFRTSVEVTGLSESLCGRFRPGHFRGVATVVLKLLQQVRPDRLYLGEKDFQQLVILRRMVRDLDLPVAVVPCPTVRESDGLALSSRNAYLSAAERAQAPRLHRALRLGAGVLASGRGAGAARRAMAAEVRRIPGAAADYLTVVDSRTLAELPGRERADGRPLRLLGAVRIGRTRLIDNIAFER